MLLSKWIKMIGACIEMPSMAGSAAYAHARLLLLFFALGAQACNVKD
jgi:hypothetical protein